jgi:hypothetical protein
MAGRRRWRNLAPKPTAAASTAATGRHEYALYLDHKNIEHTHQDPHSPDQRDLRALPSNHPERVLRQRLPTQAVPLARWLQAIWTPGYRPTMPSEHTRVLLARLFTDFYPSAGSRTITNWIGSSRHRTDRSNGVVGVSVRSSRLGQLRRRRCRATNPRRSKSGEPDCATPWHVT